MSIEIQIENIESISSQYVETGDKKSFLDLHARIALAIYDELPSDAQNKNEFDAKSVEEFVKTKIDKISIKNTLNSAKSSESELEIDNNDTRKVLDFFSRMMLIYSAMNVSKSKKDKSIVDIIKGFFIFGLAIVVLWSIYFFMAFGFQLSITIILIVSLIAGVIFLRIDKLAEGDI